MNWEQSVQWLRDQPDQQDLVKACYFDDPLLEVAERYRNSIEWRAIAALLPPLKRDMKALDLGAGRGVSSYALAKEGCNVTALEPDSSELVGAGAIRLLANQSNLPIKVVSDYSEKLPFENNYFDIVNCRQVLHHSRDLWLTCSEAARVLKPGGIMVATREHVLSKKEDLQIFLDSHPLHKFYGGENAFLLEEYLSALQSAGLIIKKILAPLDSPINYFPMNEDQHFDYCAKIITSKLGSRFTKLLLSQRYWMGRWLMKILISVANQRDHTPGRLYSFVAVKPK